MFFTQNTCLYFVRRLLFLGCIFLREHDFFYLINGIRNERLVQSILQTENSDYKPYQKRSYYVVVNLNQIRNFCRVAELHLVVETNRKKGTCIDKNKSPHMLYVYDLFLFVIAKGFEPLTVCLEGRCSNPTELRDLPI